MASSTSKLAKYSNINVPKTMQNWVDFRLHMTAFEPKKLTISNWPCKKWTLMKGTLLVEIVQVNEMRKKIPSGTICYFD